MLLEKVVAFRACKPSLHWSKWALSSCCTWPGSPVSSTSRVAGSRAFRSASQNSFFFRGNSSVPRAAASLSKAITAHRIQMEGKGSVPGSCGCSST